MGGFYMQYLESKYAGCISDSPFILCPTLPNIPPQLISVEKKPGTPPPRPFWAASLFFANPN